MVILCLLEFIWLLLGITLSFLCFEHLFRLLLLWFPSCLILQLQIFWSLRSRSLRLRNQWPGALTEADWCDNPGESQRCMKTDELIMKTEACNSGSSLLELDHLSDIKYIKTFPVRHQMHKNFSCELKWCRTQRLTSETRKPSLITCQRRAGHRRSWQRTHRQAACPGSVLMSLLHSALRQ